MRKYVLRLVAFATMHACELGYGTVLVFVAFKKKTVSDRVLSKVSIVSCQNICDHVWNTFLSERGRSCNMLLTWWEIRPKSTCPKCILRECLMTFVFCVIKSDEMSERILQIYLIPLLLYHKNNGNDIERRNQFQIGSLISKNEVSNLFPQYSVTDIG